MANINVDELNRQGKIFAGGNVAAATVSAVGTAMTGLILYNPMGSGKDLVLLEAGFAWTTVPAAVHNVGIGIVPAFNSLAPSSTGVSVTSSARAADGSNVTAIGKLFDAATYAAPLPVAARWSFNALRQAADGTLTTVFPGMLSDRIDGSIILAPGASAMLIAVTTPSVGLGSFVWAEYPANII